MPAAYSNLYLEQGTTFTTTITLDDVYGETYNLAGYTASSQMRKSYYSTSANTLTATITGNANGEITLSMTAANTALLSPGRYMYDLVITTGSTKTRVVEGIINVLPGVTQ